MVRDVLERERVLDLGSPVPFRKELAPLRLFATQPPFCADVVFSPELDLVCDGEDLPLATGTFGGVICSHVLQHVNRPEVLIAEVRRILRPGGRAYFTFPWMYPYHASPGWYRDYRRFSIDGVRLLLDGWSSVHVLRGGGPVHVAANFAPRTLRSVLIRLAPFVDRDWRGSITPMYYVVAQR